MTRSALLLALALAPSAALAVPAQLTTQGRVLDTDGAAVEGTLDVTFRLMDAASGGSTLWEETQSVEFTSGFYVAMLGADEAGNPLEDSVIDQWPLYLEVQLAGEGPMYPRMAVGSVPYARQAGVAESLVPGAIIEAGSLTVDGSEVITADGEWAGATPDVDWSDLTGIPGELADGDDADTLADLVCSDGQWAVFSASTSAWTCDGFSDTTLSDAQVVTAVGTAAVDLYTGSTMDGYTILTDDSELAWSQLTGVPSGLADGDDDTLGGLSCADGEVARYSSASGWACATASSGGRRTLAQLGRGDGGSVVFVDTDGFGFYWSTPERRVPLGAGTSHHVGDKYLDASGVLKQFGRSTVWPGTYASLHGLQTARYAIDAAGIVYVIGSSSMTTSVQFTGTGYLDVVPVSGAETGSSGFAGCSLDSSGTISCINTLTATSGYQYPLPSPPSGSGYTKMWLKKADRCSGTTGTLSSGYCTGYICAVDSSGQVSCTDQDSVSSPSVPSGTYVDVAFHSGTSTHDETTICGLDAAGDVDCVVNYPSTSSSSPGWQSCSASFDGQGFSAITIVDDGYYNAVNCRVHMCGITADGTELCTYGYQW